MNDGDMDNRADGRWQEDIRTFRVVFHCLEDSADNDPLNNSKT